MDMSLLFLFNSFSLGVGLAMDAFSVSLVNGMNEPRMSRWKAIRIAGVYGFFQALMPMLGWVCTHTIIHLFTVFQVCIPWIALALLVLIGGNMIWDSRSRSDAREPIRRLTPQLLLLQGVATSIDALSVGFAIANYGFWMALLCSLIIAAVTLFICVAGVELGKKGGDKLAGKATFWGGIILIMSGIEIWITHFF